MTINKTADLTDQQLAAAADSAWYRANMCLDGGLPDRSAAALRAVAELARQGWVPLSSASSASDGREPVSEVEHSSDIGPTHADAVHVLEKPWKHDGWLDEQGRCWLRSTVSGDWQLVDIMNSGLPRLTYAYDLSMPAAALPSLSEKEIQP